MDLQSLETEQLQRLYQLQRGLLRGAEPDSIAIPEGREDSFFIRAIERSSATIARDNALGDVTDLTEERTTPLSQWQTSARKVLDGTAGADDILLVDALANGVYGFPIDSSDGLNAAETGYLEQILTQQERERSVAQIQGSGAHATAAFERAAAETAAVAARNEAEVERLRIEASRELLTLESASAALGYGSVDGDLSNTSSRSIAGFNGGIGPLDDIVADNHEALQRHFRTNIINIREQMYTADPETGEMLPTEFAGEVMTYLVSEGDFRGDISTMILSGDEAQISQAQALLRLSGHEDVEITGEMDLATANAAIAYIEAPRDLGDTTLEYAPRGVDPEVNTNAIYQNITRGSMGDFSQLSAEELASLPPEFAELVDDIEGLDAQTRAEEMAMFLSDRENYNAYNQYLSTAPLTADMTATVSTLRAEIDELTVEAARVEALGSALTDRFGEAAVTLGAADVVAVERAATVAAQVDAGQIDAAVETATSHIDEQLVRLQEEQVGIVQTNLTDFHEVPSLAGLSAEDIVARLNDPETFRDTLVEIDRHTDADTRTMFYGGGAMKTRMDEHRDLSRVRQEIVDSMEPVGEPVEVPTGELEEIPVADAGSGDRAIVTEVVASDDETALAADAIIRPDQDAFYAALDTDLATNRDVPREIRGLAGFKRNIEAREELIAQGGLSEARISQINIEIAGFERRFDRLYAETDTETAAAAIETESEAADPVVTSAISPTSNFHLAGFGLERPSSGAPVVGGPDHKIAAAPSVA